MQFGVLQCGGLGNSWGSEEVGASLGMFTRSADKSRQPDRFPHSQAADDKDDNTSNVSSWDNCTIEYNSRGLKQLENYVVWFCVSLGTPRVFLGYSLGTPRMQSNAISVEGFPVQTSQLKCMVPLVHISAAAMLTHITESSR